MHNHKTDSIRITYRQLDSALQTLGFVRLKHPDYRVYRQEASDAVIALPLLHANALVSDPHLIAVRNTVIGRGVASWDALYAELMRAKRTRPVSRSQRGIAMGHPVPPPLQDGVSEGTTQGKGKSILRRILRDQRKELRLSAVQVQASKMKRFGFSLESRLVALFSHFA